MKKSLFIICAMLISIPASFADSGHESIQGSDTLGGVIREAIHASAMDAQFDYAGGGSDKGVLAVIAGTQGLAPASYTLGADLLGQAQAHGLTLTPHTIGFDAVEVFVASASATAKIDIATLKGIYTCAITQWEQVPASGLTGAIKAIRLPDQDTTTGAFKALAGVSAFGPCVTVAADAAALGASTSGAGVVGIGGPTAKVAGNKSLALAATATGPFTDASDANIRSASYPFSRQLLVYEVGGARQPSDNEKRLLQFLLNSSFMAPILHHNQMITVN